MALKVTTKEYKRVDLIEVVGRIDSSTAPQLEKALQKCIDDGRYHLVVQMADVEFMSSAGLRALLSAVKQVRRFNRGEGDLHSSSGISNRHAWRRYFSGEDIIKMFNLRGIGIFS